MHRAPGAGGRKDTKAAQGGGPETWIILLFMGEAIEPLEFDPPKAQIRSKNE
jgi:hypothetical protein